MLFLAPGVILQFNYTNWRGESHEYVVKFLSVSYGSPDRYTWYLNADTITRDGDPRDDMETRRRSFVLTDIREIKVVEDT